jgi:hypothetical protein
MMRKLLLLTLFSLLSLSYSPEATATQTQGISIDKKLTPDELNKIIYDALYPYVSKNTPLFQVEHETQQKIANNNVAGILELFVQAIDRKIKSEGSYDSNAHREIETMKKMQKELKEDIQVLKSKVEMLITHVTNMNDALKDNETLKRKQKYGGKN